MGSTHSFTNDGHHYLVKFDKLKPIVVNRNDLIKAILHFGIPCAISTTTDVLVESPMVTVNDFNYYKAKVDKMPSNSIYVYENSFAKIREIRYANSDYMIKLVKLGIDPVVFANEPSDDIWDYRFSFVVNDVHPKYWIYNSFPTKHICRYAMVYVNKYYNMISDFNEVWKHVKKYCSEQELHSFEKCLSNKIGNDLPFRVGPAIKSLFTDNEFPCSYPIANFINDICIKNIQYIRYFPQHLLTEKLMLKLIDMHPFIFNAFNKNEITPIMALTAETHRINTEGIISPEIISQYKSCQICNDKIYTKIYVAICKCGDHRKFYSRCSDHNKIPKYRCQQCNTLYLNMILFYCATILILRAKAIKLKPPYPEGEGEGEGEGKGKWRGGSIYLETAENFDSLVRSG